MITITGGQVSAGQISSAGAADGQVATADGAGGVAWEAARGVSEQEMADIRAGMEQAISINAPNHITVTVDMTSATWNTVATHEVFTVTGVVRVWVWVQCTEQPAGSGTLMIESSGGTQWSNYSQPIEDIYAANILDTLGNGNSVHTGKPADIIMDYILYSKNVGYRLVVSPATAGTLVFHCVWEPLSAGATVVAGAGGPL